ncbi:glycosyltransferase [Herpetosiphon sp. NSE202]|uniref:glycosyltransferase n=1 Tax=Herpetosiphon sp. NSE202 TaxID=3351349 RepID=UPI003634875C
MRLLLSSIGSRGDVQPLLALALELRSLGHTPVICVAPNFQPFVDSFGLEFVPIGPDLEAWTRMAPAQSSAAKPTPEQLQQLASHTVAEQFRVMSEAAHGCDLMLVGGMLQTAGRSIAELLRIPYVYTAYCPASLPSSDYPPATMGMRHQQVASAEANLQLWLADAHMFDQMFRSAINQQRALLGLPAITNVARYITTDHPWLAADKVLGPAGKTNDLSVWQTGGWLVQDSNQLPVELERFLATGEPPLCFGFGSMRTDSATGHSLIQAARMVGRRIILLRGWGNFAPIDEADVLSVGEVNHSQLFPRVALIGHHGGAGTTMAAALAGKPQVLVPHVYDQFYWSHRMQTLGVGVEIPSVAELTLDRVIDSLEAALAPDVVSRAAALAPTLTLNGAELAAQRLDQLLQASKDTA